MVSIIIPAYNSEKFLPRCLDSVLGSTYRDFEVILVNDGSTDGTGRISDEWAARDGRVRVIHQSNAGISHARNQGLERARGEYVLFMDSDDLVCPQMLETLVSAIESGDCDFSMVYGKNVDEDRIPDAIRDMATLPEDREISGKRLSQDELMRGLYDSGSFQYKVVWNKLYRKSRIDGMRFLPEASEDFEWNNRVCLKAAGAVLVEKELYYYVQHEASVMHKGVTGVIIERLRSVMTCLNEIPKQQRCYRAYCLKYLYKAFFYARYKCGMRNPSLLPDVKSFGKEMFGATGRELLGLDMPLLAKMSLFAFYLIPSLYNARMRRIERQ